MRISKIANSLALALPIITIGLGFINETFFYFTYYAFTLTAVIQFGIALFIILDNPKNVYIQLYFLGLLLTILVVFFSRFINLAWILPCILCVYLSIVIYASPPQKSSFMRAEWNDLIFINYEIDPKFLEKYVPKGTELDLWNGKCYLSLIGFMFENVRVLGFKIPFHVNFEEVNLRFYVKRNDKGIWKRGVVFIKEIVPKHAITFVANTLYNEHYQTLPMEHARTVSEKERHFSYRWKKGNTWNTIATTTHSDASPILENSEVEFITEHYYGYTISPRKKTVEYEVTHPRWHQHVVKNYSCTVDFETVYGNEFAFLQDIKPASCFVAKGSKITIESKQIV